MAWKVPDRPPADPIKQAVFCGAVQRKQAVFCVFTLISLGNSLVFQRVFAWLCSKVRENAGVLCGFCGISSSSAIVFLRVYRCCVRDPASDLAGKRTVSALPVGCAPRFLAVLHSVVPIFDYDRARYRERLTTCGQHLDAEAVCLPSGSTAEVEPHARTHPDFGVRHIVKGV